MSLGATHHRRPTLVRLRCKVIHNMQCFWKGDEAKVVDWFDGGRILVKMKGRSVPLERKEYEILAREKEVDNGTSQSQPRPGGRLRSKVS